MNTPHRESAVPDVVPYHDFKVASDENAELRDKLGKANDKIASLTASNSRWDRFTDALPQWSSVGWALLSFLCLAAGGALIYYGGARGFASGERARHNAEREAIVYATRINGAAPVSVYCAYERRGASTSCMHRMLCTVRNAVGAQTRICCDDDEAVSNDGCRPQE